jgi:hypothetical protein
MYPILVVTFIYGVRKKIEILVISFLSFYFLLATHFGIGEPKFFNGRLSYFFVFHSLLLMSIIFISMYEKLLLRKNHIKFVGFFCLILLSLSGFVYTPSPWFPKSEKVLFDFKSIYKELPSKLKVMSEFPDVALLSKSLNVKSIDSSSFLDGTVFDAEVIILDLNYEVPLIWRYLPKEITDISWYQDISGENHTKHYLTNIFNRKNLHRTILSDSRFKNFKEFKLLQNNYVIFLNKSVS